MEAVEALGNITEVIDKAVVVGERATLQRTNCNTLLEPIRHLKPLLDEVRDWSVSPVAGGGGGGGPATFDGLELAVTKAKELLDKCGASGSKVYTDLRAQGVVSKFQDVTLEIDRSLNSLPLVSLRVSDHIRSQVELVTRELRRAKYFVDPIDERLGEDLEALLREQRDGLKCNDESLRRIADRLGLQSVELIMKEIQALEAARDEARVEKDKSEEELLNQALQLVEQMKNCFGEQAPGLLEIPSDFRCPLSQELMSDPVIVASGQTYERTYIQHWISEGYTRCPKTGQVLSHKNLIPNYTVKALIANWCEANNVPLPGPVTLNPLLSTLHPLSPATPTKAESDSEQVSSPPGYMLDNFRSSGTLLASGRTGVRSRRTKFGTLRGSGELERVRNGSLGGDEGEPSQAGRSPSRGFSGELEGRNSPLRAESTAADCTFQHARSGSNCSVASSVEDGLIPPAIQGRDATQAANERYGYSGDLSGDMNRINLSGSGSGLFNEEPGSPARRPEKSVFRRRGEERDISLPRIVPDTSGTDSNAQSDVDRWVEDLQSSDIDVQRQAAAELRLLAKHNMENRITIANSGAIKPLVALLKSSDPKTQENAVTALLNLSINDNNKAEIAHAGAIGPLVNVLRVGNSEAMENAAATLFSLSVMDDNKITIGASGAISPLVHLLINGTPRGKKDAATALFNLSIYHENKGRIVQAGAIKPLVELMAEPAAGMVDKAVAVLANLATISEGRQAIGDEHGIPALVEVVEAGSQRGKENAAAALLQLCTNNNKHRALVLQEGAIPPLVALSQSGTARAKEKASALLRHFREQRHGGIGGRSNPDRHMAGHY